MPQKLQFVTTHHILMSAQPLFLSFIKKCIYKMSYIIMYLHVDETGSHKQSPTVSQLAGPRGHVQIIILTVAHFYLVELLPALDEATLRGPQVTAPLLGSD